MRSLRLAATVLALTLVAAACSDDDSGDGDAVDEVTTTTAPVTTTTTQPLVTPPTTAPVVLPPTTIVPELVTVVTTSTTVLPAETVAPPVPPSNVKCRAGSAPNELTVEFDALPDPSAVSKIRVYVSNSSGAMVTNGEYTVSQIDTTRAGGSRWAARARGVEPGVPVRLTATSFNQLGRESGWYIVGGLYTGPGEACGSLPATSTTAG
ncbi:MAG: hypothetical protein OXE79_06110 [Acidimicrobiaceae bacterium]|nr:hypothetical protein [Acidimicrobiaceae bacterium]MCY4176311.1 hypothetical protein [Acidimicrobiaceae bacterium]MCY4280894.1 hypothetical protein [Acidimicrobiaceae bacterium]MCY4294076.1 hypothetical protein [Acidimicrobiaceae bacterium]